MVRQNGESLAALARVLPSKERLFAVDQAKRGRKLRAVNPSARPASVLRSVSRSSQPDT